MWVLLSLALLCHVNKNFALEIRMPDVRPDKDDEYVCFAKPLNGEISYITKFQPKYDPEVTHHMILFACDKPARQDGAWSCAEHNPVCLDDFKIIFSWAMNAPPYEMPEDTSFKVGGDGYKYLVLQVHYKDANQFKDSVDNSGWILETQKRPTAYLSGVYILVDGTSVLPPKKDTLVKMECTYTGKVALHPFAFRVHAHSHGLMNKGFVEHNGTSYLIGEKSPQDPQTFYPVKNHSLKVEPGDQLKAECLFRNDEDKQIAMGQTREDEMCNFYIMYAVPENEEQQLNDPQNQDCFTAKMDKIESELNASLSRFKSLFDEEDPFKSDTFDDIISAMDEDF